ncbi:hypothetical protein IW140_006420 [Coemansia sp. RSA 1813]|nr:hypothetical protein EV178_002222 [Coemansia sp. RSA 1646]KAJ1765605.1 hypothetical protein LPJ74_006285 [Coemansia sp. RSA 1843]KAJ2085347.1 hypothetical protein IW138_006382 [Coemansia sp. RSA 986]KAJ2217057.1 hypothetical protein EV179_000824 [Coemansia sp. RSA 487]KAJ2562460.1 hypothetical protein IW140_006420 [Coemansia sp. RSA 1813]
MQLYQQSFGFREPYQVLVSADFILESVAKHLEVVKTLEDTLQGKVKPLITFCSIRDVRTEGEHRSEAIAVSKSFEKRRCPHKDPIPGNQCISEVMGDENKYNYCVAAQDEALRTKLRKVPGVPLVHIKQTVMILGKPQSVVKEVVASKNRNKLGLSELERKMLEAVKKKEREDKLAHMPLKHKAKKKGPKGPNPLSMKKSKKEASAQTPSKPKLKPLEIATHNKNESSNSLPTMPVASTTNTKRNLPDAQQAVALVAKKAKTQGATQQPDNSSQSQNTPGQQNKRKRKRSHAKGKKTSSANESTIKNSN